MFRRLLLVVVVSAGATAWVSATASAGGPLVPGDRIGSMQVARAAEIDGPALFPPCEPLILQPGRYRRACTVRATPRLFIGYGDFRPTLPALNRAWRSEQWQLYVDGHEVFLRAFGTADRTLFQYPPGSHTDSILREWRVTLLRPTRGLHSIRYITIQHGDVIDVTFVVRIRR